MTRLLFSSFLYCSPLSYFYLFVLSFPLFSCLISPLHSSLLFICHLPFISFSSHSVFFFIILVSSFLLFSLCSLSLHSLSLLLPPSSSYLRSLLFSSFLFWPGLASTVFDPWGDVEILFSDESLLMWFLLGVGHLAGLWFCADWPTACLWAIVLLFFSLFFWGGNVYDCKTVKGSAVEP